MALSGQSVALASHPARDHASPLTRHSHQHSAKSQFNSQFNHRELDALRAFAFLMVFCSHIPRLGTWFSPIQQMGGFGVALFFVLSAYLIITLLLRERDHTGTVRVGAFAMRRILRIWPLYFLVIALGFLVGLIWTSVRIQTDAIRALVLIYGNVFVAHRDWTHTGVLNPLWSISVEEQFYIAIPFLVLAGGRRALSGACGLAVAGSYIALFWLGRHRVIPSVGIWANSFVNFQFFAAGGVIALISMRRKISLSMPWRCLLAASAPLLFYIATMVCDLRWSYPIPVRKLFVGYACELAGVTAIFLAIFNIPLKIPHPLVYLGKVSYGLYLVHFFLLWFVFVRIGRFGTAAWAESHQAVATLAVLAACIVVAAISYEFFEKPILRWKQRFEIEKTRI